MFSHAWISHIHKLKITQNNDEYSGGVTLTLRNPWNTKSLKIFTVSARQSWESLVSSYRDELQEPSFKQAPKKIAVSPGRDSNDQHEIEYDENFCLLPYQSPQFMYRGLRKTTFDINKEPSLSNKSNNQSSRWPPSIKRSDLI